NAWSGGPMRDIRSDLQERASLIEGQIRTAYAHFEKTIQQLQYERDAKIAELKSDLSTISRFIEIEERFAGNVPSPAPSPSPLVALADLFMQKLNETGQMSRQELVDLAVGKGFFPDAEHAIQGVHPMLVNMLRGELIRELPDGNLAPPTLSQA